jgi:hypothetical protein
MRDFAFLALAIVFGVIVGSTTQQAFNITF